MFRRTVRALAASLEQSTHAEHVEGARAPACAAPVRGANRQRTTQAERMRRAMIRSTLQRATDGSGVVVAVADGVILEHERAGDGRVVVERDRAHLAKLGIAEPANPRAG